VPLWFFGVAIPLEGLGRPIFRDLFEEETNAGVDLRHFPAFSGGKGIQLDFGWMGLQKGGPSRRLATLGVFDVEDELVELRRVAAGVWADLLVEAKVLDDVLVLTHLILHLLPDLLLLLVLLGAVLHVLVLG
jgi:hypothetical protein